MNLKSEFETAKANIIANHIREIEARIITEVKDTIPLEHGMKILAFPNDKGNFTIDESTTIIRFTIAKRSTSELVAEYSTKSDTIEYGYTTVDFLSCPDFKTAYAEWQVYAQWQEMLDARDA